MIVTISTSLCFASMIASTVLMFIYGNKTYNQDLTWGAVGLLLITVFCMGACCGAEKGGISMFEDTYREERAACIAASKEAAAAKEKKQIPVVPAIKPDTITVTIQ